MSDLVKRLRDNEPLVICPYDRKSPEYWTTPNDAPCKFCGGLPEGPDKCTGADTRIFAEAADRIEALEAENKALREALECLVDEQNGPPLDVHAKSWCAAMDRARALLAKGEK